MTTLTEQNYLKAIYILHEKHGGMVTTSLLAEQLDISAASVTDFVKKMAAKKLIRYEKSKGVNLMEKGKQTALQIIRKHRLWEVWLVEKLGFKWDQVHDIAEQLEHIESSQLIEYLDKHLGFPQADPHGDLIPDAKGRFAKTGNKPLSICKPGDVVRFTGVSDHSNDFLRFLTNSHISLGDEFKVESVEAYDNSFVVCINSKESRQLSRDVVKNILVTSI
jgi:DtxR family Mn-dependent transcriptional regulator